MMDYFSLFFQAFLLENKKVHKTGNTGNTHCIYINFEPTDVFIGYENIYKFSLHLDNDQQT